MEEYNQAITSSRNDLLRVMSKSTAQSLQTSARRIDIKSCSDMWKEGCRRTVHTYLITSMKKLQRNMTVALASACSSFNLKVEARNLITSFLVAVASDWLTSSTSERAATALLTTTLS